MSETAIRGVRGRRVWDSRGRPTVEAEVHLAGGAEGRAIAPAGASTGSGEALDRRDGGAALGGYGVAGALAAVNGEIAARLAGLDAGDQGAVDAALVALDGTPNKARLGGNATIAVSMAVAHAAAAAAGQPLYRHLGGAAACLLPLPEIQVFGGGAHAARRLDLQDFMVVPLGAASFDQACEWVAAVYLAAGQLLDEAGLLAGVADEGGYWPAFTGNEAALEMLVRAIERAGLVPGAQMAISLDIAATQLRRADGLYHLAAEDRRFDRDAWCALLLDWCRRYPVVSIEDPLAEDDLAGTAAFTRAAGDGVQVVGDDLLVTSAERVKRAAAAGAATCLLVKPNQAGTLSEARAAFDAARAAGLATIVSARSGESEDTTIVHLAVGWSAGQLKVGSFARSERLAKWNEALRIEAALGERARFAGAGALGRRGGD